METWIDGTIVFSGKIFTVRTGTVRLDDGRTAQRDVVENPGGVGDERIQIITIPLSEIEPKLRRGEFEDAKTIIGLHALLSYITAPGGGSGLE